MNLFRRPPPTTETQSIWPGASGRLYEYYVKKIDTRFIAHQWGNFIICKLVRQNWQPLYIGEGDIDKMVLALIKQGCVMKKQATHIHERLNPDPERRQQEAQDIIRHHPEVFAPGGCMARPASPTPTITGMIAALMTGALVLAGGLAHAGQTIIMHDKLGQRTTLSIPQEFNPIRLGHGNLPVGETAARIELRLPESTAQEIGVDPLIKLRFAPPGATRNMIGALATQYRHPVPGLVAGLNAYANHTRDSVLLIEPVPEPAAPALWICDLVAEKPADCHLTITNSRNIETRTIMTPFGATWPDQIKKLRDMVDGWAVN